MRLGADHVRVRVPATSANLGPGFDALGLALEVYDDVEVWALGSDEVRVEVEGHGEAGPDAVPRDGAHLVAQAIHAGLERVGAPRTGLVLRCRNRIPHGRGLGSSAAATLAGVLAARLLVADPGALDDAATLALVSEMEGHPDNAAPALTGGATVAWTTPDGPRAVPLPLHPGLDPAVLVPTGRLSTRAARAALPATVPHADAAHAAARAALLVEALAHRPELLFDATEDRLHQEYRRAVMPATLSLVDRLRARGLAAVVSGAGPSVLVLGPSRDGEDEEIASALGADALDWRVVRPGVDRRGAHGARV